MTGAICIAVILLARVVQNYYNKKASSLFPVTMGGKMRFVSLTQAGSAMLGLLLFLVTGAGGGFSYGMGIAAGVSGLALAGVTVCSALALQSGTMVLTSVCGTAGVILPCVAGIFLFNEPVAWPVWVCIAVFLAAAYLLADSAKDTNPQFSWKTVLLLIGSFVLNGVTMLCQKTVTYIDPEGSIALFSLITFAVPAVLCGVGSLPGKPGQPREKLDKGLTVPILCLAAALFLINQLATVATKTVSSAVLFTLINGGNTVIAAIVAAVCFGEKPTVRSVLGLILGAGSLILINIFQ